MSMIVRPGWNWSSFRNYFQGDQLSDFAGVINAANGNFSSVEPYSETGSYNDPHAYLDFLGEIARVTHVPPLAIWNFVGVGLQMALVVVISSTAFALTRRWWSTLLGSLPFIIGTMSFSGGSWYTTLKSHAVLWASFGSLFTLNSAAAGIVFCSAIFLVLIFAESRKSRPIYVQLACIGVAAGIGILANVDTYCFFTAAFFGVYGLSIYAISKAENFKLLVPVVILVVVLFLVGPELEHSVGRLVSFAFGLIPAVPGLWVAMTRWRRTVILALLAAIGTAAPELIGTVTALHAGNPFLVYRQGATSGLGIDWEHGLLCSVTLLVPLALVLFGGLKCKRPLWIAYSAGSIIAWFLLSTNDAWGTNQEPYQLWIDSFAIIGFTIVPIALEVIVYFLRFPRRRTAPVQFTGRAIIAMITVVSVTLISISSVDWLRFYRSLENGTFAMTGPQQTAEVEASKKISNRQLVFTDLCLSPWIFKAVTGARVGFYSLGLAWPTRYTAISTVWTDAQAGKLTAEDLSAAGIGWMVTDANCGEMWGKMYGPDFIKIASFSYSISTTADAIQLWKLRPLREQKSS
jgi:hypothetical protein